MLDRIAGFQKASTLIIGKSHPNHWLTDHNLARLANTFQALRPNASAKMTWHASRRHSDSLSIAAGNKEHDGFGTATAGIQDDWTLNESVTTGPSAGYA